MCSLYDTLQAEFCPPLDTSLLAAFIADLDLGGSPPPSDQLDTLRATLRELANQATEQYEHELANELNSAHLSPFCLTTDESNSCPDFCAETTECSTTSDSSAISQQSFGSPLGFLQAALPHIPPSRLRRALSEVDTRSEGHVDMESVVEFLLTNEFIRELEERSLDVFVDDGPRSPYTLDDVSWKRVESKKKATLSNGKAAKKNNVRGKTIPIVDVRQRHHLTSPTPAAPPALDPWTQLSSLSEYLATLLPPYSMSYFLSHFHSPNYSSPAKALRSALSSIVDTQSKSPSDTAAASALSTILDVLCDSPTYASLDTEQRFSLYADAQLALRATCGHADDAIDIVWLLLDLDLDFESGTLAMGVYHAPKSPFSPRSSAWVSPSATSSPPPLTVSRGRSDSTNGATRQLPSGPSPLLPPPTSKRKNISPSPETSPTTTIHHSLQWQTVPRKPPKGPHPLALYIPAYNSANQSRHPMGPGKIHGMGNGMRKGGNGDMGELMQSDPRQRIATNLKKRDEMLREASKAWNRGNSKTRGGEVALVFAERAREFHELARRERLDEARILVESKRSAYPDRNTVDLHGTSIAEAVVIVKEILERETCSPANPLRIITGRGAHSVNGVGVLKPAVRNALVRDGWNVGVWDGGLVVRGRT